MSATLRTREDTRATADLRDAASCLRDGRARDADRILARMQFDGVFASNGKFWYPAADSGEAAIAATDILPFWCITDGLRPFTVKPHNLDNVSLGLLSGIFDGLRESAPDGVLPHWLTDHYIVSLYLPDAADLRPSLDTASCRDAQVVHDICTTRLGELLDAESQIRTTVTGMDLQEFPLLARYHASRRIIGVRLGPGAAADLDGRFDPQTLPKRRCPLFDSKPANLIMRREDRYRLSSGALPPRAYRVDLDMAYWGCPVGLELVLIYFSHPIAFEIEGKLDDQVDHQLFRLDSVGRALEAGSRAQLLQLTWYHLVRNFASAIELDDTAKALEMGRMLQSAARHVGLSRKSSLIRAIDRWREGVGKL
jgi:hypothetical protein